MKEELYDDLFDEREEKTDYSALLFPYIIRWPWIVASVVVCVALAWVYLRFATPVYNISATVLIKDDKKGGSISSDLALFQDMGMLSTSGNVDNEIEILRSKSLAHKVVSDLGLYITYSLHDGLSRTDLYRSAPFRLDFPASRADSLSDALSLKVTLHPDGSLQAVATLDDAEIASSRFDSLPPARGRDRHRRRRRLPPGRSQRLCRRPHRRTYQQDHVRSHHLPAQHQHPSGRGLHQQPGGQL